MNNHPIHLKKGKFIVNISTNLANFLIAGLIGIWFTPYLIKHLGVAAFGLIPLANTVTSYMGVFTLVINAAVGRFMTISLEQGKINKANQIFNSSFFGTIFVILILIFPAYILISHVNSFFNVPLGYETDFKFLFIFTILAFFITALGSAFQITTFCSNRFELRNLVDIASMLAKILIVLFLFQTFTPKIWHVGAGIILSTIVALFFGMLICRYLTPILKLDVKKFNFNELKELTKTGGWIFISQIGTILIVSIDLIVANKLFGPETSGRYASILQWSLLIRQLAMVVSGIFAPTIIYYYAQHDTVGLINYSRRAVKFLGLFITLPIALLCGFSRPLLEVWLGQGYVSLAPLLCLMLIPLSINLGYLPLHNITIATNNVKWPAIVQIITGLLNLLLAIFLAGPMKLGVYGIALAGGIVLLLRNVVFTPIYAAHITNRPISFFFKEVVPISFNALALCIICWYLAKFINLASWNRLIASGLIVAVSYISIVYTFFINKDERIIIRNLFRLKSKKTEEVINVNLEPNKEI